MNNPLAQEAQRLANKSGFEPSGQIILSKKSTTGPWAGKYVTVMLNFYGTEELTAAVKWAISNGYEPSAEFVSPGAGMMRPTDLVGHAPLCPIHGTPMKSSKKPGSWFCPKRVGGGFCTEKA